MSADESIALDPYSRWQAWEPVVAAIEEALDVPGLPPEQRAALCVLHNDAAVWLGRAPVEVPRAANPSPKVDRSGLPEFGTDGLARLFGHGLDTAQFNALVQAGLFTVPDVIAYVDSGKALTDLPRIGRKRADEILTAALQWEATRAPAGVEEGGNV